VYYGIQQSDENQTASQWTKRLAQSVKTINPKRLLICLTNQPTSNTTATRTMRSTPSESVILMNSVQMSAQFEISSSTLPKEIASTF
jgi:hypothetical protein